LRALLCVGLVQGRVPAGREGLASGRKYGLCVEGRLFEGYRGSRKMDLPPQNLGQVSTNPHLRQVYTSCSPRATLSDLFEKQKTICIDQCYSGVFVAVEMCCESALASSTSHTWLSSISYVVASNPDKLEFPF
jgi:hypothetical protein